MTVSEPAPYRPLQGQIGTRDVIDAALDAVRIPEVELGSSFRAPQRFMIGDLTHHAGRVLLEKIRTGCAVEGRVKRCGGGIGGSRFAAPASTPRQRLLHGRP